MERCWGSKILLSNILIEDLERGIFIHKFSDGLKLLFFLKSTLVWLYNTYNAGMKTPKKVCFQKKAT